jgi:trehalose/maltose transport system substrate-binding protein
MQTVCDSRWEDTMLTRNTVRFLTLVVLLVFALQPTHAQDVTIRFWLGDVNNTQPVQDLLNQFTQETGIKTEMIKAVQNTTDNLAQLQQVLAARSTDVDVIMFDVTNPGLLAPHLIDLNPVIQSTQLDTSMFYPHLYQNNIVDQKLVGLPWFTDAGLLYYRTDLLTKYGFNAPPKTWDELTHMAGVIQDGERSTGNGDFWGFVWEGNDYEGLTCNALEWQYSNGGGSIIEADKTISVNNPKTAAALTRAAGWVGTISPVGVTTYTEDDARKVWQAGNAAFMRNWPYAYVLGQGGPDGTLETKIKGLFDVTTLPAGDSGSSAATLGGWQLGVSAYSQHPKEAEQLLLYLIRPDTEKTNAIKLSWLPTIKAIYSDPEVAAQRPFMAKLGPVFENAIPRPSAIVGSKYTEISTAYYGAVHDVITGKTDTQSALDDLELKLRNILGSDYKLGAPPGS